MKSPSRRPHISIASRTWTAALTARLPAVVVASTMVVTLACERTEPRSKASARQEAVASGQSTSMEYGAMIETPHADSPQRSPRAVEDPARGLARETERADTLALDERDRLDADDRDSTGTWDSTIPSEFDPGSDSFEPTDPRVGLHDPDPRRRVSALETMDRDHGAVGLAVAVLQHDPDPSVRVAALEYLESEASSDAIDGIVSGLNDPDVALVIRAIEAIEFVGETSLLGELLPYLDHEKAEVRAAAAEAIESID